MIFVTPESFALKKKNVLFNEMSDDEDDAFKKFLLLQLEVLEFAKTVKLIHDLW